ncbi:hypothetical protein Hdeb2414_s0003g00110971 [Helianthus debilis subsp. tardiflorus]
MEAVCVEGEVSPIPGLTIAQYQQFINLFGSKYNKTEEEDAPVINMAGNISKEGKWIVDSGATKHITHDDSLLKNKKKRKYEPPVTIPNGEAITIEGRGDYTLPNGVLVRDVLHVPEFKCNLLSVSRLSKDLKCAVILFPDFCVMQDLSSRTLIGVGECQGGLYKMRMMGRRRQAMMTTVRTWHKRLELVGGRRRKSGWVIIQ